MPDINSEYRKRFLKRQLLFEKRYRDIFDRMADQFAKIVNDPNAKFTKAFRFPPVIVKRMNGITTDMHGELLAVTEDEITRTWDLSNEKNDKIVSDYLKTITNIKAAQSAAYYMPNIPALKAFISGKHGAETLSDAVWTIARQFRAEMEVHIGIGVVNGTSAQVISQRIRQYLVNPDALFRRVRDASGKLVPSQRMREYHPGQGIYKSAYKNAMRIARSETNAAYHSADTQRWAQIDFVVGIRISLSGSHPQYNFPEICEICAGDYPKNFDWQGWHPQCLCHATPIMTSQDSFRDYLKTGQRKVDGRITEYPQAFKDYVQNNYERFSNYKSVPYWIQDNKNVINGIITQNNHTSISKLFIEQRNLSIRSEFLSPLTVESLKDSKIIMLNEGKTGCIITPDGDLENVFNNAGKGEGGKVIKLAIENGAKKLDCFDGYLPKYYKQFGFEEVKRVTWDDQYAPPNWNYEKMGRPDVVYMEIKH